MGKIYEITTSFEVDTPTGVAIGFFRDEYGTFVSSSSRDCIFFVDYYTKGVILAAGTIDNPGNIDGQLTSARFNDPTRMAYDQDGGRLYVADKKTGNIRIVTFADEQVTTMRKASGDIVTFAFGVQSGGVFPGMDVQLAGSRLFVTDTESLYSVTSSSGLSGLATTAVVTKYESLTNYMSVHNYPHTSSQSSYVYSACPDIARSVVYVAISFSKNVILSVPMSATRAQDSGQIKVLVGNEAKTYYMCHECGDAPSTVNGYFGTNPAAVELAFPMHLRYSKLIDSLFLAETYPVFSDPAFLFGSQTIRRIDLRSKTVDTYVGKDFTHDVDGYGVTGTLGGDKDGEANAVELSYPISIDVTNDVDNDGFPMMSIADLDNSAMKSGAILRVPTSAPTVILTRKPTTVAQFYTASPTTASQFTTSAPTIGNQFVTNAPTNNGQFSTSAPTVSAQFSTASPTSAAQFVTSVPTTSAQFSTEAPTTVAAFLTSVPTTAAQFQTASPTPVEDTLSPTAAAQFVTNSPTASVQFSTSAPTVVAQFTTAAPTTIEQGESVAPTTAGGPGSVSPTKAGQFVTNAPTTTAQFSTASPTTLAQFSTASPTSAAQLQSSSPTRFPTRFVPTDRPTTSVEFLTQAPSTSEQFSTRQPTTAAQFLTQVPTTAAAFTTQRPTSTSQFATNAPTTASQFATAAPTTIAQFATARPTTTAQFLTSTPTTVSQFSTDAPSSNPTFSPTQSVNDIQGSGRQEVMMVGGAYFITVIVGTTCCLCCFIVYILLFALGLLKRGKNDEKEREWNNTQAGDNGLDMLPNSHHELLAAIQDTMEAAAAEDGSISDDASNPMYGGATIDSANGSFGGSGASSVSSAV